VDEMSSGEARRIVIGRALVHSPQALVLDEPTTSLDFRATHELREIFRRIAQQGTTIVLVTHNLPDIIPEIGRVILIDNGQVAADGPKHEILTASHISRLFGMPLEIAERNGYFQVW